MRTLSRYQDVAAALRDSRLVPVLPRAGGPPAVIDAAAHAEFRAQALRALAPPSIAEWQAQITARAHEMSGALPADRTVDLMEEYARPWSLEAAALAANVPGGESARLATLAARIFDAACEPFDESLGASADAATSELARFFAAAPAWHLQMFVALAHSLPAFLGNCWLALLEHPAALAELRQDPALLPAAIDELLRFAGPAKAQFRQDSVTGERVILRLDLANRDPEVFPDPDSLQFTGRARGHLAFGSAAHACVGSALIQSAGAAATGALLERLIFAWPYQAVPVDAFAMRYVRSLLLVRS